MRKTVLAAVATAGLAIIGIGGAALAATDGPDRSPASVLSTADPTAPAAIDPTAGVDDTPDDDTGTPVGPSATATPHDQGDDHGDDRDRAGDDGRGDDDSTATPTATTPAGGTAVSGARAAALAVRHVGGGQVTEVELEREHGRTVWKIEVSAGATEYDILVDAGTGAIVRVRQDH